MNFNKTSFGSIKCENLLNCDISTSKGMEEAKEKEYFNLKCNKFVRDSLNYLKVIDSYSLI